MSSYGTDKDDNPVLPDPDVVQEQEDDSDKNVVVPEDEENKPPEDC